MRPEVSRSVNVVRVIVCTRSTQPLFYDRAEVAGEFIDMVVFHWLAAVGTATIAANRVDNGKGGD